MKIVTIIGLALVLWGATTDTHAQSADPYATLQQFLDEYLGGIQDDMEAHQKEKEEQFQERNMFNWNEYKAWMEHAAQQGHLDQYPASFHQAIATTTDLMLVHGEAYPREHWEVVDHLLRAHEPADYNVPAEHPCHQLQNIEDCAVIVYGHALSAVLVAIPLKLDMPDDVREMSWMTWFYMTENSPGDVPEVHKNRLDWLEFDAPAEYAKYSECVDSGRPRTEVFHENYRFVAEDLIHKECGRSSFTGKHNLLGFE